MTLFSPRQRRILLEAFAIALLGIALGFTVNYRLVLSALGITAPPSGVVLTASPTVATLPFPAPIELAELQTLLAAGSTLIDARNTLLYAEGHLPNAISLPLNEVNARERPLPNWPKEKTLIVYCGGYGCDDSFTMALLLRADGYSDLRVFEGGYPQWADAQLPIEKGAP